MARKLTKIEMKLVTKLVKKKLVAKESLKALDRDKNIIGQLIERRLVSAEYMNDFIEAHFYARFVCPECGRKILTGILGAGKLKCPDCGRAPEVDTSNDFSSIEIVDVGDPLVGYELAQYLIKEPAGQGARGVVYRAIHENLQRPVALKVLRPNFVRHNREYVDRFMEEARTLAQLVHPNVIKIYDAGEDNGLYYMAMEFAEGGSLKEKLRRLGTLWEEEALEIVRQIAEALITAHGRGLIHLDIKPANIMITQDGTAKLSDFGLVRQMNLKGAEAGEKIRGTPAYISPEQARNETLDERSDIYSLGISLFRILTGGLPYGGSSHDILRQHGSMHHIKRVRTFKPEISREADAITWKMVRKARDERYQSAVALKEDIERYQNGREPLALAERLSLKKKKAVKRRERIVQNTADPQAETGKTAFYIGLGILGLALGILAYILLTVLNANP